jgi:processive 1,2-diacylglycerol beta-glucosyltransferase
MPSQWITGNAKQKKSSHSETGVYLKEKIKPILWIGELKMDKILILTETVAGYGHYSAANSLKKAIRMRFPSLDVHIVCMLPLISKPLETLIGKFYTQTLRYAPSLWGAAYAQDREWDRFFREPLGKFVSLKLKKLIDEIGPKLIVCTHAFCLSACTYLKQKKAASYQLGAVVTDFDVHSFWIHPDVDFYIVAHEEMEKKIRQKTSSPRVYATGIPIDPSFSLNQKDACRARLELGLDVDRFTILLMGGGSGMGPIKKSLSYFRKSFYQQSFQLLIITGNNQPLYEALQNETRSDPHIYTFPFVHNMVDFMCASDFIITKPGGMTSSEALAIGLPMLICRPIPGQEESNSQFLLSRGAAIRQDEPKRLPEDLSELLHQPKELTLMRKQASSIGKPYSSFIGAEIIADHLH